MPAVKDIGYVVLIQKQKQKEEYSEEDYDLPEDDPDVKDIRWF